LNEKHVICCKTLIIHSFECLLLLCSRVAIYSFNVLGQRSVVELEQWNVDSPQVG